MRATIKVSHAYNAKHRDFGLTRFLKVARSSVVKAHKVLDVADGYSTALAEHKMLPMYPNIMRTH